MNRLRELRKERGLTLRELADKVNISFANIGAIEREYVGLNEDTINTFCSYFNVSADYLLGRTDISSPASKANFIQKEVLENLTENDKKLILDLATNLAEKNRGGGIL